MSSLTDKLEKVQYLNNKNIDLAHRGFTGSITIHWFHGEPMEEENLKKNKIKLEK